MNTLGFTEGVDILDQTNTNVVTHTPRHAQATAHDAAHPTAKTAEAAIKSAVQAALDAHAAEAKDATGSDETGHFGFSLKTNLIVTVALGVGFWVFYAYEFVILLAYYLDIKLKQAGSDVPSFIA